MQQWYHCPTCQQYIQYGQPQCHNCGTMMGWTQPVQQKRPAYSRSFNLGVVGESFNNDDGSSRQEILKRCTLGEQIQLIHEPHPKDKNAVKICRMNGEQIGWISKEHSTEFANILKRGNPVDAEITKLLGGYPINCVIKITKYSDKPFAQNAVQSPQSQVISNNDQPVFSKQWWLNSPVPKLLFIVLFFIIIGAAVCNPGHKSNTETPAPKTPIAQASPELQQERSGFINDLKNRGVIYKIEKPGIYAHVWVTPMFHALKFDDKESFINVIYAYYISENPESNLVVLYDSQSGKEVGKYATVYGGLKME